MGVLRGPSRISDANTGFIWNAHRPEASGVKATG